MRILIVEDDHVLADGLVSAMRQAGHAVDWIDNGEAADNVLRTEVHDLVVLDLGLPLLDGFQVLRRLRTRQSRIPVLILTAKDELENRIKGLDLGADDYLTKPFDLSELDARVRALLRRAHSESSNELHLGPLCFDITGRRAMVGTQFLELSARETSVLELLLRRAGRVASKEQILEGICSWDQGISDNAIEVYIHRLRKKLDGSGITIRTVRGLGYIMDHAVNG